LSTPYFLSLKIYQFHKFELGVSAWFNIPPKMSWLREKMTLKSSTALLTAT
jgi:hypothetical protein